MDNRPVAYFIHRHFYHTPRICNIILLLKWKKMKWKVQLWFKVRSKTDSEPAYSLTHHANKSSRWADKNIKWSESPTTKRNRQQNSITYSIGVWQTPMNKLGDWSIKLWEQTCVLPSILALEVCVEDRLDTPFPVAAFAAGRVDIS